MVLSELLALEFGTTGATIRRGMVRGMVSIDGEVILRDAIVEREQLIGKKAIVGKHAIVISEEQPEGKRLEEVMKNSFGILEDLRQ